MKALPSWIGFAFFCVAGLLAVYATGTVDSGQLTVISLGQLPASVQTAAVYNAPAFNSFLPVTGGTIVVPTSQANVIINKINPSATLALLTIDLPLGDHAGQILVLTSTQALTSVTYVPASGSVLGAGASLLLNGYIMFYWDGSNWVRCG